MRLVRCTHCLRAMPTCTGCVRTPIGLRLLYGARILAEMWHAWRTGHEMLRWYQWVSVEEPQLTGGSLYVAVIVRRSGLDIKSASGLLQRVRASFCEWPSPRKLRYRDVVHYVVVEEYMRSHLTEFRGTYTNMRRVVANIIPYHL